MNHKQANIVMEFIVGLLVAIPLALFFFGTINRCTNISAQAGNNFETFFNEIEDLAKNGKDGEVRTFMLIMDQETMIMNFWPSYAETGFYRCVKDLEEQWSGPDRECSGQDCFCLIQKYNLGEIKPEQGKFCKTGAVNTDPQKARQDLLTKKNIPTTADDLASPGDFFNQVRKIEITKSKCFRPEGFHIYQIQPSSLYPGWPRFSADVPRRIPVGLVKDEKEGRIYICQNPPCQVPANPEKHS